MTENHPFGLSNIADLPYTIFQTTPVTPQKPITDYETLVTHLHQAAQVEMSTIPMYLYAAYSIDTKGHTQWNPGISAARTIIAVAIEEMLHLCLVRNLIVAIGAGNRIKFYDKEFMPTYPSNMLHRVPLLPLVLSECSTELMDSVFMPLEYPAQRGAKAQSNQYETLGQFYMAIQDGLNNVDRSEGSKLWRYAEHNAPWQYDNAYWNRDGGGLPVEITDLHTAQAALNMVVEQGEGVDPDKAIVPVDPISPREGIEELSHYARFSRIQRGIEVIGKVRNVPFCPTVADHVDPENPFKTPITHPPALCLAILFNAAYCYTLAMLDKLYELPSHFEPKKQSPRYHLERTFIAAMQGLLYPIADLLTRTPGTNEGDLTAGPTFEYYKFDPPQPDGTKTMKDQLLKLCDDAITYFPELGGDNSVRWLLTKMPDINKICSQEPKYRP
jgi:Ferritin-like